MEAVDALPHGGDSAVPDGRGQRGGMLDPCVRIHGAHRMGEGFIQQRVS